MSTDADAPPRRRPALVTIAVVLVYVSGLSNAAIGLLILLSRYQVPASDVLLVSVLGAAVILLGLLTVAVASALARGSRLARLLTTLYLAVLIALHALTIAETDWDPVAIAQLAAELFVLVVVWVPPGRAYFRRSATLAG